MDQKQHSAALTRQAAVFPVQVEDYLDQIKSVKRLARLNRVKMRRLELATQKMLAELSALRTT